MKKKPLLLAGGLAMFGSVVLAVLLCPSEPSRNGLTLSQSLEALFPPSGSSAQQKAEAEEAIHQMGADALPWLMAWFSAKGSPMERWFSSQVYPTLMSFRVAWFVPWHSTADRNVKAIWGFKALGRAANPAIPELLRFIQNSTDRVQAYRGVRALCAIGTGRALDAVMSLEGSRPYFKREALLSTFVSENPHLRGYGLRKYERENPGFEKAPPRRLRLVPLDWAVAV
jgi:hypothetical protein